MAKKKKKETEPATYVIDITPPPKQPNESYEITGAYGPESSNVWIKAGHNGEQKQLDIPFNPNNLDTLPENALVEFRRGEEVVAVVSVAEISKEGFHNFLRETVSDLRPTLLPADPKNPTPIYTIDVTPPPHDAGKVVSVTGVSSADHASITLSVEGAESVTHALPLRDKLRIPRDSRIQFKKGDEIVAETSAVELLSRTRFLHPYYVHLANNDSPKPFPEFADDLRERERGAEAAREREEQKRRRVGR